MPKIRNIIFFILIALVVFLVYFFFLKKEKEPALVISSSATIPTINTSQNPDLLNSSIVVNSLPVLLSIQDIKLDLAIFSNTVFDQLKDSSILLTRERENEGRSNPFSPIGSDTYLNLPEPKLPAAVILPTEESSSTPNSSNTNKKN